MADGLRPEHAELLRRIESHAFDVPGAAQSFESRLASENGWTLAFARRAIREYRRYVFLYAISGRPVAPSDVVDEVWHLHLLYTRNYWNTFCKDVIGKPLHHEPAAGVEGERKRLGDWYADTLHRYRQLFGEPPADIWPSAEALARRPKPRLQRVDIGTAVILSRRAAYAIAALVVIATSAMLVALFLGMRE
jgi:hypothetical protein